MLFTHSNYASNFIKIFMNNLVGVVIAISLRKKDNSLYFGNDSLLFDTRSYPHGQAPL